MDYSIPTPSIESTKLLVRWIMYWYATKAIRKLDLAQQAGKIHKNKEGTEARVDDILLLVAHALCMETEPRER